jgi:phospholipid/cholesterol/gamma-HCH transport system substrate-binding protein
MKKHSVEIKVGIVMTLALAVFIWLFNYVKGLNILKPIHNYYIVYDDIHGLQPSNAVYINGYKVGLVDDIHFLKGNSGRLLVALSIEEKIRIPNDSRAVLYSADLMGTKAIRIVEGSSGTFFEYGDTIPGMLENGLVDQITAELMPLKDKTEHLIETLDSLATVVNQMFNEDFQKDFANSTHELSLTMTHMRKVSYTIDTMMTNQDGQVQMMLRGVRENLNKLDYIMSNLAQVSDSLSDSEIKSAVNNLNATLEQAAILMQRINNGEGSLGKLTTNDSLYFAIQNVTMRLDTLVTKITENPKKYIRIKLF